MEWDKYFDMMVDWKQLPAYRTEPRIDSLIGFYLKDILESYLHEKISGIIPEFPLRLGTINPECEKTNYKDKSYKIDFLAVGMLGKNFLIEFKSDSNSLRENQDKYLERAKRLGTRAIVEGALRIADISSYTKKYSYLKSKMLRLGIIKENFEYSGQNPELEVIYVKPSNKEAKENVIEFDWIADWMNKRFSDVESFEKYFAATLRKWKSD
jgi:hypothetical protein